MLYTCIYIYIYHHDVFTFNMFAYFTDCDTTVFHLNHCLNHGNHCDVSILTWLNRLVMLLECKHLVILHVNVTYVTNRMYMN